MHDNNQTPIIAIIDYGSGNLRSAAKAFEHVIVENNLNFQVLITNKAEDVCRASHIVLPGQGAFRDCMSGLQAVKGMVEALEDAVLNKKIPFLGICVGMQLLAGKGLEYGEHKGLNWIEGEVIPIPIDKQDIDNKLKIPHMGWNTVKFNQGLNHPVLKNQKKDGAYFYFVHSFMFQSKEREHVIGQTNYGGDVTSIVAKANMIGVQFHPEKSQGAGLQLLHDFLLWNYDSNTLEQ